jgi:GNAT superfamily N-acetyltransferase
VDEADALTQIAVRAAKNDGYDNAAIGRFMPALKVNLALIAAGLVAVGEDEQGNPLGYTALRPTGMGGLVLLESLFVDPTCSRGGIGKQLFAATVEHSRRMEASVILVYASPKAVGFYVRQGGIRIGMTPFIFSPDMQLSMFAFSISTHAANDARTP